MKAPTMEYKVYPMRQTVIDKTTGELSKADTGRFRQRTYKMRPGKRALMCELLRGRCIDHMIFGQGEGKRMALSICEDARREL